MEHRSQRVRPALLLMACAWLAACSGSKDGATTAEATPASVQELCDALTSGGFLGGDTASGANVLGVIALWDSKVDALDDAEGAYVADLESSGRGLSSLISWVVNGTGYASLGTSEEEAREGAETDLRTAWETCNEHAGTPGTDTDEYVRQDLLFTEAAARRFDGS